MALTDLRRERDGVDAGAEAAVDVSGDAEFLGSGGDGADDVWEGIRRGKERERSTSNVQRPTSK